MPAKKTETKKAPTKKTTTKVAAKAKKVSGYAIIQLLGKQFKVAEGQTLVVDKIDQEIGSKIEVTDVLLLSDGKEIKVGTPLVEKAKVVLEVVAQTRSPKIRVATYKAKSRSRKVKGHRSHLTELVVKSVK